MRLKKQDPTNFPTLICAECEAKLEGYPRYICDDAGVTTLVGRDIWPTYFRDVLGIRIEFCGAECGLRYCQKN